MSDFPIGMLRRAVRDVCNIRPGYPKTEEVIVSGVNSLLGGGVSLQEIRDAIEFNHSERFIRSEKDKESETTGWFITAAGQAHDKIK